MNDTAWQGLVSEIGAGRVIYPKSEEERSWNRATNRAIDLIRGYWEGRGLFQIKGQKDESALELLYACFDENGELRESCQDQLSVALEAAERTLAAPQQTSERLR